MRAYIDPLVKFANAPVQTWKKHTHVFTDTLISINSICFDFQQIFGPRKSQNIIFRPEQRAHYALEHLFFACCQTEFPSHQFYFQLPKPIKSPGDDLSPLKYYLFFFYQCLRNQTVSINHWRNDMLFLDGVYSNVNKHF